MSVSGFEGLFDVLFAVHQVHLHAERPVQVFGQVLCRVDGAVLAARAAEADGQTGEATFHVALHGGVHQGVDMLQESGDFTVVLQEADDGLVQAGERLVAFVLSGVVHGAAVEDKASPVARRVFGDRR